MRRVIFILLTIPMPLVAQISFTPFVGLNSTRLTEAYGGYGKGGNYLIVGIELEGKLKPKPYSSINLSVVTGVNYLPNGFKYSSSFPLGSSGYSFKSTDIQTTYWQVPAILRINWRPFPLVENWRLFFGAGISYNTLTYAHISEQAIAVQIPFYYYAPVSSSAQVSQDVTSLAVKSSIFNRFELGMKFKHLQVAWRLSFSTRDMYFQGYEKIWTGSVFDSHYIYAHDTRGITKEKYSELVFGWRF